MWFWLCRDEIQTVHGFTKCWFVSFPCYCHYFNLKIWFFFTYFVFHIFWICPNFVFHCWIWIHIYLFTCNVQLLLNFIRVMFDLSLNCLCSFFFFFFKLNILLLNRLIRGDHPRGSTGRVYFFLSIWKFGIRL